MHAFPISDEDTPPQAAAAAPADAAARLAALAAAPGSPGHYDELRGRLNPAALTDSVAGAAETGPDVATSPDAEAGAEAVAPTLAPLWQRFFTATGQDGWHDLASRRARVQRKVLEDGATYNVHSPGSDTARTWPLELLPLLIGPDEWARIERGVNQRARLLDAALKDIYGEQHLLHDGLLPASLIYGHPQYLRPMHGVQPPGGHGLHVVALDLARGPDGHWWVVGHRAQSPSGLGYLLENRLTIAQQFPEAFRELKVQRIASALRALVDGLSRASGAGALARLALLTPGPRNETYFEHVFLARYLGLTLVEGSDLTVRDERVYLKTLNGLERVDVLLRRVDDEWLDPLELRPDSALGVPGLVQAVRAGGVLLANLPGAGVLESPGLTAFWPAVSRRLLKENLLLPATTSWWCGEATVWATHRESLADFVIVPTFPAGSVTQTFEPVMGAALTPAEIKAWQARIDANPAAHTLMAPVRPSELPIWCEHRSEGRIEPRPVVLRVYALRDADGDWCVLPGGLTRVAAPQKKLGPAVKDAAKHPAKKHPAASSPVGGTDVYLSMQRGSASTDTWVLTRGEVDATTLLPRPLQVEDLANSRRVITSRAAENLFWLGRYTERAENTIRLARLTLEALPTASAPVLEVLQGLLWRHGLIGSRVPSPMLGSAQATRVFERTLVHSLGDLDRSTSVAYNLRALRLCAEALRERLSPEHWSLLTDLDAQFTRQLQHVLAASGHEPLSDVLAVLNRAAIQLSAITGAQTDRMTRDDGWRLLSVGRQIERLDTQAHALAQGFAAGLERIDDGFALLLALFDSTITYRAHFQARREVPPLLHLLVLDTDNPRSLAWVARTMRERLRKLARLDPVWSDAICAAMPAPQDWSLAELCAVNAEGGHAALAAQLLTCSQAAQSLSNDISRHLFSHVGATDRTVWQ